MPADQPRILCVAKTLAELCDDDWETLVAEQRRHYQREGAIVIEKLDRFDRERASLRLREALTAARARGSRLGRPPGSVEPRVQAKEAEARALLRENKTRVVIRAATGLGNSTITRIRNEMLKEQGNATMGSD